MMRIGKYQVLGLLGRGGMGAVYKVRQPVTGRICALKLLAPNPFLLSLLGSRAIERQFLAEARALSGLDHPNLVQIWDFGRTRRGPYFLMEYHCRGLSQVIGETRLVEAPTRPLPLPRAAAYALQTLDGLARLHDAGIVHRDVKPANLLITDQDRIKVTDLGLSRVRGEHLPERPGLKVGSPYYAAPEQEDDPGRAGPRADLYSLGVTLLRMLLGQAPPWPFRGDNRVSLANPDLDRAWDDFFNRVLSPNPKDRPESAKAMARELEGLLTAWRQRLEKACRDYTAPVEPEAGPDKPRGQAMKVCGRRAREIFDLDELWRPRRAARPRFERQGPVLLDRATGLLWQAGGSEYALSWPQAGDYLRELNAEGLAGSIGWRLPTVGELATILAPAPRFTGHCLAPEFDPAKGLMWSADRRTFTQAWFADADLGAVCWADMTCRLWVRAVRSA